MVPTVDPTLGAWVFQTLKGEDSSRPPRERTDNCEPIFILVLRPNRGNSCQKQSAILEICCVRQETAANLPNLHDSRFASLRDIDGFFEDAVHLVNLVDSAAPDVSCSGSYSHVVWSRLERDVDIWKPGSVLCLARNGCRVIVHFEHWEGTNPPFLVC